MLIIYMELKRSMAFKESHYKIWNPTDSLCLDCTHWNHSKTLFERVFVPTRMLDQPLLNLRQVVSKSSIVLLGLW